MERRRHPGQQRPGERGRQRQRELPGRAADVASRIERAVDQRQRRLAQHPGPERKLVDARAGSCACAASRCAQRRNEVPRGASAGSPPARNRRPGRRQVRHQDAPRHAVDRQMMDGQQQPAGRVAHRHRTTPPAPSRRPPAPAGARPLAPARRCRRAAQPHRARRHRSAAGSRRAAPRRAARPPGSTRAPSAVPSSRSRNAS